MIRNLFTKLGLGGLVPQSPFNQVLFLVTAMLLVIGLAAAIIFYFHTHKRSRKHRHHHHHHHHGSHTEEQGTAQEASPEVVEAQAQSALDEPAEAGEHGRRRRRRRRRREHRPRNPTLAETGGLPPIRTGEPPGP